MIPSTYARCPGEAPCGVSRGHGQDESQVLFETVSSSGHTESAIHQGHRGDEIRAAIPPVSLLPLGPSQPSQPVSGSLHHTGRGAESGWPPPDHVSAWSLGISHIVFHTVARSS